MNSDPAQDRTQPPPSYPSGFEGEVRRHYTTRSDVQDLLKPMSDDLKKHQGYHDGFRFTVALVIPLVCVLITASAIIVAAVIGL